MLRPFLPRLVPMLLSNMVYGEGDDEVMAVEAAEEAAASGQLPSDEADHELRPFHRKYAPTLGAREARMLLSGSFSRGRVLACARPYQPRTGLSREVIAVSHAARSSFQVFLVEVAAYLSWQTLPVSGTTKPALAPCIGLGKRRSLPHVHCAQ